jgi:hypothetical protein
MHNRNKSRIFYIQVLLLIFVFLAGVFAPTEVFARMERTTGSGMAEGDPGDGDDSIGGGGGGGTIPDGAPSASIAPEYPTIIFSTKLLLNSDFYPIPVLLIPFHFSVNQVSEMPSFPLSGFGGE